MIFEAKRANPDFVLNGCVPLFGQRDVGLGGFHPGAHLHGYLRFDPQANRSDKEASDKLVFAGQEYFDFFNHNPE